MESLRRRASRFGLDLILVNIWEGADAAEEAAGYCQRWDIRGTVLLDETAEYARSLGVRGVPTNVFVDASGVVRTVGATTSKDLMKAAARLEPRLRDAGQELPAGPSSPIGFSPEQSA